MANPKNQLGRGINFPIQFSVDTGGLQGQSSLNTTNDVELIRQSIMHILSTPKGSRVQNREFGSDLSSLVFRPMDAHMVLRLREETVLAITRWEPRVLVEQVQARKDPTNRNTMIIEIRVIIIRSGESFISRVPFNAG